MNAPVSLIVPLRRLDEAKSRLAGVLSTPERVVLARACATSVLTCGLRAFVVCDDPVTADFGRQLGATPIMVSARGLNPALAEATPIVRAIDPTAATMIAHADLPFGGDLLTLAGESDLDDRDVVVVPDRHGDGTNVVIVGPGLIDAWVFAYGPGSFAAHLELARRLEARVTVVDHPRLNLDLDTADDLADPRVGDFVATHLGRAFVEERAT
ncbi:MAG: 2-phospho-L-lactate guanylyltransferase [Acidimicrobiia bacterium]